MKSTNNLYYKRFVRHQAHKKRQLASAYGENFVPHLPHVFSSYSTIIKSRRSQRIYNRKPITDIELSRIFNLIKESPSSCNRQPISVLVIKDQGQKELLAGLLVGAIGWAHRADTILLFFADPIAYHENLTYMPFLDAGMIIMNAQLTCEAMNVGCAYINPNIRKENINYFNQSFNKQKYVYCGALALGHYDKKAEYTPKAEIKLL